MENKWNKSTIYLVVGVIVAGVFALGAYYYFSIRNQDAVYIDQASGAIVSKKETGGIETEGPGYIGVTETIPLEVAETLAFQEALSVVKQYFTIVYPNIESLSFVKDSGKRDGDNFSFLFKGSNGQEFVVEISNIFSSNYKLEVSDTNNRIYSYSPILVKLDPAILAKVYLPYYTSLDDGTRIALYQRSNGDIELAVNACGDQKIIEASKEKINDWLSLNGFDPNDFSFSIPTYCDGESY